ncbi:MAG: ParB N-terminal domain-containing protein [Burkholderiales bacterium]|nr:ParB N-terminal domain-containing protein [Burkholderiales bacterium]
MKRKAVKKAKPTKRPARKSAPKRGARVPKLAVRRKAVKKAKPTKRPARKSAPKRGARVPKLAVRRKAVKKAKPTKRPARKSAPKRGARVPKLAVRRKAAGGVAPARPPAPPPAAETRLVSQIKVGARFRKDMGDLEALKRSIETRGLAGQPGLLQPIAITPKNELIAGERRLEAWKRSVFRDTPIPVHVVDVDAIVRGEWDENDPALRKNFTPSEMVAIKRALEPKLKAEAAERKRAHGGTAPGKKAEKKGKGEGRAADLVATFAGKSRRSIEKAEKVVEAAERDKARFGDLVDDMDKSGKVDAAFKKLQVRAARDAIKAAPPPLR